MLLSSNPTAREGEGQEERFPCLFAALWPTFQGSRASVLRMKIIMRGRGGVVFGRSRNSPQLGSLLPGSVSQIKAFATALSGF